MRAKTHDSQNSYATVLTWQHPSDVYLSDISPFTLIESETGEKIIMLIGCKNVQFVRWCTSTEVGCDLWLT
jgi:hypothetical protein